MPDVVSQCTAKMCVIEASSFRALDRDEIGWRVLRRLVTIRHFALRDIENLPWRDAVGAVDQHQHVPPAERTWCSIASTANVPEPCIGTVT
jgi:hypothetical protein